MPTKQAEAINTELHPRAEQLAREYIDEFSVSLLLLAKILAYRERADVVLSNHIREARRIVTRRYRRSWLRDLLIIVGSALFGAFVPGFVSELLELRTLLVLVYAALGFLGVLLIWLGLRQ